MERSKVIFVQSDTHRLSATVVPAQHHLAAGALVLHLLQAVHAEGDAEAGPQHGQAEDGAHPPCQHAGGGGGLCRDALLAAGTDHPDSLAPQIYGWQLHHPHHLGRWGCRVAW